MVLRPSSTRSSRLFILLLHIFSPLTSRLSLLTSSNPLPFPSSPTILNHQIYWLQSPTGLCLSEEGWGECTLESLWRTEWGEEGGEEGKQYGADDMFRGNPEEYKGLKSLGRMWRIKKYDANAPTEPPPDSSTTPTTSTTNPIKYLFKTLNKSLYKLPLPSHHKTKNQCLVLSPNGSTDLGQCFRAGWSRRKGEMWYEGDERGKRGMRCVEEGGECVGISFIPFKVAPQAQSMHAMSGTDNPNFSSTSPSSSSTLSKLTSTINRTHEKVHTPTSLLSGPAHHFPPIPPSKKDPFKSNMITKNIEKNTDKIRVNVDIPVNPYTTSTGIWVDPVTNLEYPNSRNGEILVGVGQYFRTVFNIKVYGVALYVDEDGVLVDSRMKEFGGVGVEELRGREGFFKCLRSMSCEEEEVNSNNNGFGRTIMLKLNMQLSTDTMRSSLEADWELLSAEHKRRMTESSFRPRPAGKKVLEDLREGKSMCTCGQIAPEQFEKADRECCARGTELSFGWKGDEVTVRLNGEFVDSFNDPSMAAGIFYEYMRSDDPISPDARSHFPDGFPSLLAPLAQFAGETPNFITSKATMGEVKNSRTEQVKVLVANLGERMGGVREVTQQGLKNAMFHIQRPKATLSTVVNSIQANAEEAVGVARGNFEKIVTDVERLVFKKITQIDEIPPEATPEEEENNVENNENNSTVVYAVHLYLILLLMVSLPMTTRGGEQVILRRPSRRQRTTPVLLLSPHNLSIIEEGVELRRGRGLSIADDEEANPVPKMRKSLSYYL